MSVIGDIWKTGDSYLVYHRALFLQLRQEARIVAQLVGSNDASGSVWQNEQLGLPAVLMPEQARFCASHGVASVVQRVGSAFPPPSTGERLDSSEQAENPEKTSGKRQHWMTGLSIEQLADQLEKDHERKRKKLESKKATQYAKERHSKLSHLGRDHFLQLAHKLLSEKSESHSRGDGTSSNRVPFKLCSDYLESEPVIFADLEDMPRKERCRYLTFGELHRRGWYLTGGCKFGGDYLVYRDDPATTHASYVAVCAPEPDSLHLTHLLAQLRVAHSVHKELLLCQLTPAQQIKFTVYDYCGRATAS